MLKTGGRFYSICASCEIGRHYLQYLEGLESLVEAVSMVFFCFACSWLIWVLYMYALPQATTAWEMWRQIRLRQICCCCRAGGGGEKGLQLIENPSSFEQHKIKQMQCDIGKLFCHQVRLASVQ